MTQNCPVSCAGASDNAGSRSNKHASNSGSSGWLKKVLHHVRSHVCIAWKLRKVGLHGFNEADQDKASAFVALHQTSATRHHPRSITLTKAFLPFCLTIVSFSTLPSEQRGSAWSHPWRAKPRLKLTIISAVLGATSANSSLDQFQQVRHLLWPSSNGFHFLDSATLSFSSFCRSLHFASAIALF
jgi:hypothetical protein